MCWLKGLTESGKSTVAQCVSEPCADQDRKLEGLYKQIFHTTPSSLEDSVKLVLGTIIFLAEPLSLKGLERLFSTRFQVGHIRLALPWLRSVLVIPDDEEIPIQIFHESLREFVIDKRRSGNYFLDPSVYHTNIARLCLGLMSASLGSTETYVVSIPTGVWRDSVNGAVTYACHHWVFHFAHSSRPNDLANDVKDCDISAWLRALNVFNAKHSLESAIQWLDVSC